MITEFARITGIPEEEILGKRRYRRIVDVRHLYFYRLGCEGFGVSEIARLCGCDHSTVVAAKKRVRNLIEAGDRDLLFLYELTRKIKRYGI